jgi:anti-sigma regulatory factor (Ser/Thr protein kinase)
VTGPYPVVHVGSFGSAGPVRSTRPWARTFRGVPASVPEARRFVAELLVGCPAREVLMTCVSELSTNAIVHTASGQGGAFTIEVTLPRPGVARIAVTDEGALSPPMPAHLPAAGLPGPPAERGPLAEGGRGLALVAAYTSRWGYTDAHPGRTVWAEATWPVSVPTQPASAAVSTPGQDGPRKPPRRPGPGPGLRPRFSPRPPPDGPAGPAA